MTSLSKQEREFCWRKLLAAVGEYTPVNFEDAVRILGQELADRLWYTVVQERGESTGGIA